MQLPGFGAIIVFIKIVYIISRTTTWVKETYGSFNLEKKVILLNLEALNIIKYLCALSFCKSLNESLLIEIDTIVYKE